MHFWNIFERVKQREREEEREREKLYQNDVKEKKSNKNFREPRPG